MSGEEHGWANPAPAGLIAVAIATILFYASLTGKFTGAASFYIGLWLIGGFVVQLVVALIELKEGSITGGNVFLFFCSFFMMVGGVCDILSFMNPIWGLKMDGVANGWAWIILLAALVLWTPAYMKQAPFVMSTLVMLLDVMVFSVTFMKLGIAPPAFKYLAAYSALLGCFNAMYFSTAMVINPAFGREIMPVGKPMLQ
jgi:Predicted membrane protein